MCVEISCVARCIISPMRWKRLGDTGRRAGDAHGGDDTIGRVQDGRGNAAYSALDLFVIDGEATIVNAAQLTLESEHLGDSVPCAGFHAAPGENLVHFRFWREGKDSFSESGAIDGIARAKLGTHGERTWYLNALNVNHLATVKECQMHGFANFKGDAGHDRTSFITDINVIERAAAKVIQMQSEAIAIGVDATAKQPWLSSTWAMRCVVVL